MKLPRTVRDWLREQLDDAVQQPVPSALHQKMLDDIHAQRLYSKLEKTVLEAKKLVQATDMRVQALPEQIPDMRDIIDGPRGAVSWFDDRYYRIDMEQAVSGNFVIVKESGQYKVMDRDIPIFETRERHVFFPSSTTLLGAYPKPRLTRWRGDIGNQAADYAMETAAEKGSSIHHACYTYANNGVVVYQSPVRVFTQAEIENFKRLYDGNVRVLYSQEQVLCVDRFVRWWNAVKPSLIGSEDTVVSFRHQYAGTCDYILRIEGGLYNINGSTPLRLEAGLYIVDLKSGKNIWDEHTLQLASYVKAFEEDGSVGPFRGALIVHLAAQTRSGIPGVATTLVTREEIEHGFEDFLSVKKIWTRANADSKPRIYELPTLMTQVRPWESHSLSTTENENGLH